MGRTSCPTDFFFGSDNFRCPTAISSLGLDLEDIFRNIFCQKNFIISVDAKKALNYWRIVDRIIQEIALQQPDGTDPDMAPVDLHVKHIIEK